MNRSILIIVLGLTAINSFAQVKKPATATKPAAKTIPQLFKNNNDSVSYAVGVRIAQSLKAQGFEKINMALFQKAMNDVAQTKTPILPDAAISECIGLYQQKINAVKQAAQQKENAAKGLINRQEGQAFLAINGKRASVVTLPSGVQYEIIKAGPDTGARPTLTSTVTCHYLGTFINGTKFQSSYDAGKPITYPLIQLVKGWQDALQLMTVGSKWKLYIPADMAYGDNGPPDIGPGVTLIFEMELLGFEK